MTKKELVLGALVVFLLGVVLSGHFRRRTPLSKVREGATAVCVDGTYSHAHTARRACLRHGGVQEWLRP